MREPTATSVRPEAVAIWRADCDFTRCKGGPHYRVCHSLVVHPLLCLHGQQATPQGRSTPRSRLPGGGSISDQPSCEPHCRASTGGRHLGLWHGWWTQNLRGSERRDELATVPDDTVCSRQVPLNENYLFSPGAAASDSPDVVVVPRHLESSLDSQWWGNTNLKKSQGSPSSTLVFGFFPPFSWCSGKTFKLLYKY